MLFFGKEIIVYRKIKKPMHEDEIISLFKSRSNKIIGDDVAFIKEGKLWKALATDSMSEGIHFHSAWSSPEQLAKKLLAANVSDFNVSSCKANYALLNLGLSKKLSQTKWLNKFSLSLLNELKKRNIILAGGDTFASKNIQLNLSLYGSCKKPLRRSSIQEGDYIFCSSTPGMSLLGFYLLTFYYKAKGSSALLSKASGEFKKLFNRKIIKHALEIIHQENNFEILQSTNRKDVTTKILPKLNGAVKKNKEKLFLLNIIIKAIKQHLQPVEDIAFLSLQKKYKINAAMDLSDGLLADLKKMAKSSGIKIEIDLKNFYTKSELFSENKFTRELLLKSGEEYSVIFSMKPSIAKSLLKKNKFNCIFLGKALKGSGLKITNNGRSISKQLNVFSHF